MTNYNQKGFRGHVLGTRKKTKHISHYKLHYHTCVHDVTSSSSLLSSSLSELNTIQQFPHRSRNAREVWVSNSASVQLNHCAGWSTSGRGETWGHLCISDTEAFNAFSTGSLSNTVVQRQRQAFLGVDLPASFQTLATAEIAFWRLSSFRSQNLRNLLTPASGFAVLCNDYTAGLQGTYSWVGKSQKHYFSQDIDK